MKHFHLRRKSGVVKKSFDVKDFLKRRKLLCEQRLREVIPIQMNQVKVKNIRPRLVFKRRDINHSQWWEYVQGGTWADAKSRDGKLSRRRFRVSHEFFLGLVEKAKELFPDYAKHDGCGRPPVPIALKVLGVLRVLGRGVCFDDAAEGAFSDEETHRKFLHQFCHRFSRKLSP